MATALQARDEATADSQAATAARDAAIAECEAATAARDAAIAERDAAVQDKGSAESGRAATVSELRIVLEEREKLISDRNRATMELNMHKSTARTELAAEVNRCEEERGEERAALVAERDEALSAKKRACAEKESAEAKLAKLQKVADQVPLPVWPLVGNPNLALEHDHEPVHPWMLYIYIYIYIDPSS